MEAIGTGGRRSDRKVVVHPGYRRYEIDLLQPAGSILNAVFSFKGVGLRDLAGEVVSYMKQTIQVSQEHYPERSFKIYILNIPRWFDVVLKLVRPFLAQATQAKMNIYRSKYSEKLLADIDAEVLPER